MTDTYEHYPVWRVIDIRTRRDAAIYLTHAQAAAWVSEHPDVCSYVMLMPRQECAMVWQVALKFAPRISAVEREDASPDVDAWQRAVDAQRPYVKRKQQKWGGLRK